MKKIEEKYKTKSSKKGENEQRREERGWILLNGNKRVGKYTKFFHFSLNTGISIKLLIAKSKLDIQNHNTIVKYINQI